MKIALASDHRGYEAKRRLTPVLQRLGHQLHDFGCDGIDSVDYIDMAAPAARAVASGEYELGVFFDGSGIGMSVSANKVPGVRAALVHDEVTARRSREQNHCNVVCVAADLLGEDQIRSIVETFVAAHPILGGRHQRRVDKVKALDAERCAPAPEELRAAEKLRSA